jgi:adenosylcobyric acid synthase
VAGTYVHGLFAEDPFRSAFLAEAGVTSSLSYGASVDATLDGLAEHLERHIDIDRLLAIAGYGQSRQAAMAVTSTNKIALAAK